LVAAIQDILAEQPELTAHSWALAPLASGWQLELAGLAELADWRQTTRATLVCSRVVLCLAYSDATTGRRAFAPVRHGRLAGALFVAREPVAVGRSFVAG